MRKFISSFFRNFNKIILFHAKKQRELIPKSPCFIDSIIYSALLSQPGQAEQSEQPQLQEELPFLFWRIMYITTDAMRSATTAPTIIVAIFSDNHESIISLLTQIISLKPLLQQVNEVA